MRRPALVATVLLAALLATPLAGGRYVFYGHSPWDSGYPLNPQLYCAVVYDEAGEQDCYVRGNVRGAEIVRVRIVGTASAHVSVVDMQGPINGYPEQRAIVDCSQTCVVEIPGGSWDDPDWAMYVFTTGGANSVVQVSVESGARTVDELTL